MNSPSITPYYTWDQFSFLIFNLVTAYDTIRMTQKGEKNTTARVSGLWSGNSTTFCNTTNWVPLVVFSQTPIIKLHETLGQAVEFAQKKVAFSLWLGETAMLQYCSRKKVSFLQPTMKCCTACRELVAKVRGGLVWWCSKQSLGCRSWAISLKWSKLKFLKVANQIGNHLVVIGCYWSFIILFKPATKHEGFEKTPTL